MITRINSFCSPVREVEPQIMEPHVSVEVQQETRATAGQYNLCRVLVGGEGERQVARSRPRPRARTEWEKVRYKKYNSLSITSFMLGQYYRTARNIGGL